MSHLKNNTLLDSSFILESVSLIDGDSIVYELTLNCGVITASGPLVINEGFINATTPSIKFETDKYFKFRLRFV